jgi:hypothetical protein
MLNVCLNGRARYATRSLRSLRLRAIVKTGIWKLINRRQLNTDKGAGPRNRARFPYIDAEMEVR